MQIEILNQLRHPCIIQFCGVVVDSPGPPEHYIITGIIVIIIKCALKYILRKFASLHTQLYILNTADLAERGSLFDLLHKAKYQPSQEERLRWAIQIAEGSIISTIY